MSFPAPRRLVGLLLGACTLALAGVSGAAAQYYPPGYYGGPPPGYYRPAPQPDYYGDGYYRPRRVPMGNVCVTARGDCAYRRPLPMGTVCKCHIPGFGPKRGVIQ